MEWLVGVIIGGIIGLGSALIVTEYGSFRERARTKTNIVRLLLSEISSNRGTLEDAVSRAENALKKGEIKRFAGAAFSRTAFGSCMEGLALVPSGARDAVMKFYSGVSDVEWVVQESYFQEGRLAPDKAVPPKISQLRAFLQVEFRDRTRRALESAESPT